MIAWCIIDENMNNVSFSDLPEKIIIIISMN